MANNKYHLKKVFIEEFEKNGGFVAPTCQKVGIHKQTFYDWEKSDPAFKEKCDFIIDLKTDQVKKSVFAAAVEDKHFPSAKYIIETRFYRQRENEIATKVEMETANMDADIEMAILKRRLAKLEAEKLSSSDEE